MLIKEQVSSLNPKQRNMGIEWRSRLYFT